jgi:hypothetical protein
VVEPTFPDGLGRAYALARKRAAERRRQMEQFNAAEFAAGAWGWLADLCEQARQKTMAATDPELRYRHSVIYWHLRWELRERSGQ